MLNSALNKTLPSNDYSYQPYGNNANSSPLRPPPVQIQIYNGQQQNAGCYNNSLQATFQPVTTTVSTVGVNNNVASGGPPITFAFVPDLNAFRPYLLQVTEGQSTPCRMTMTNGNPSSQNTQAKSKRNKKRNLAGQQPLKSASPILLPKTSGIASCGGGFSMTAGRTPSVPSAFAVRAVLPPNAQQRQSQQPATPHVVNSATTAMPSPMTIQLTVEDQEQISILTDELKRIVACASISPVEREKLVENLQQKRSAILEKTFLQQQRFSLYNQRFSVPNGHTVGTQQFSTVHKESFSVAPSPTTLPAQIVQINGMPYLALTANSQHTPAQLLNQQPSCSGVIQQVNGSQDFQRVHAQSTFGLQLPVRPHLISCQNERNAGQSSSYFLPSNYVHANFAPNVNYCQAGVANPVCSDNGGFVQKNDSLQNVSQIVENVRKRLSDDQYGVTVPDCKTAFRDKDDIRVRLMPYHLYHQPDVSERFLDHFDSAYSQKMKLLSKKKSDLFQKFQSILLKESTHLYPKSEDCVINELISKRERNLLEKDRKFATRSPDRFVRMLKKRKEGKPTNASDSNVEAIVLEKTIGKKILPQNDIDFVGIVPKCVERKTFLQNDFDTNDIEALTKLAEQRCREIKEMFKAKSVINRHLNVSCGMNFDAATLSFVDDRVTTTATADVPDNVKEELSYVIVNPVDATPVQCNDPKVHQLDIPCYKERRIVAVETASNAVVKSESDAIADLATKNEIVVADEEVLTRCDVTPRLLLKINQKATKRKRAHHRHRETASKMRSDDEPADANNLHKPEEEMCLKKVPPLKIKISKPPAQLQPLTRLSSIGLESSDEDDDDNITPVAPLNRQQSPGGVADVSKSKLQRCYVDLCNTPCVKVDDLRVYESRQRCLSSNDESLSHESASVKTPKLNMLPLLPSNGNYPVIAATYETPPWDHSTAQFIRSKLKIKDSLSPTEKNQ